ncbi:sugar ABC transporter permease [Arthrobacter sp. MYb229]|uniref:carbohydrate ABC transporter permease n=1 Tax=Micrococcaceae TaxID=1268 RepID=UPI000BB96331|nr:MULTISPECIES: sugar ABC transporter permease [Micrococcaceae]PCC30611.1 ABC transporter permease [Glutamicibacter sp. BW80]PRA04061.1 sugar ABC transporter permease [Arthrobacter sp. MYb229]PRB52027.1 sugar ABC transporter permease [Arthrobacter sp. MYb216]
MSAIAELSRLSKTKGRKAPAKDNKAGHLFLLPWTIGLFLITLGPMAMSLYLSFTDYNLLQAPEFVGMDNIERMFSDERLHNSLRVTFTYVLVGVPLQLGVALGVAMLLDRGMRGLSFYRSIFYLPSMLGSSVAIAVLWKQIFGTTGLVNQLLGLVGIEGMGWISDPSTSLSSLILLNVWTFGSPMVIFLAGLRQIPAMYYEAASIDGATKWRQFVSITLPMLSPIIFFNLVLQVIGAFQNFTQAFIVSNGSGGPADSTMFFTLYLYQQGFKQFDMGYASAMAWLLVLIVGGFTALNFFVSKYWVFYDD